MSASLQLNSPYQKNIQQLKSNIFRTLELHHPRWGSRMAFGHALNGKETQIGFIPILSQQVGDANPQLNGAMALGTTVILGRQRDLTILEKQAMIMDKKRDLSHN